MLIIESCEVFEQHYNGLIIAVMREHPMHIPQQLLKEGQLG